MDRRALARYIVPSRPSPDLPPVQRLGRIDSGEHRLRCSISCAGACRRARRADGAGPWQPARRFARRCRANPIPIAARLLAELRPALGQLPGRLRLAGVVREALQDAGREQIDLLAIDSCHVQFLELAYELEDIVQVLIAPQTGSPSGGWDYRRVLGALERALAAKRPPLGTSPARRALLDRIVECYRDGLKRAHSVSALDLQRLDDVASTFDTLCIGTLQALGEGLIWETRELLLRTLKIRPPAPVYDCGSLFVLWAAALNAMADEAYQGWLGTTLQRASGHEARSVLRGRRAPPRGGGGRHPHRDAIAFAPQCGERIALLLGALASRSAQQLATAFAGRRRRGRVATDRLGPSDRRPAEEHAREEGGARARRRPCATAIKQAFYLLPRERQIRLQADGRLGR